MIKYPQCWIYSGFAGWLSGEVIDMGFLTGVWITITKFIIPIEVYIVLNGRQMSMLLHEHAKFVSAIRAQSAV